MSIRRLAVIGTTAAFGAAAAVALATTHTATSQATANKAGSKKRPAPFVASFRYDVTSDGGGRPPSPLSWSWKWKGVKIDGAGFPKCTSVMIDAAQSDSVCPKGSLFGEGDFAAQVGPESDNSSNVTCTGKTIRMYNAGAGQATFYAVGPPDNCAGLGYLAPTPMNVTTAGSTSTVTIPFPENLTHPLPGVRSGLNFFAPKFNKLKVFEDGKTRYFMSSVACSGQRKFTFTVKDDEGTHVATAHAGKCS